MDGYLSGTSISKYFFTAIFGKELDIENNYFPKKVTFLFFL